MNPTRWYVRTRRFITWLTHSCDSWWQPLWSVIRGKAVCEVVCALCSVTRQNNLDPVLGIIGSELDNKQLPSNKDIIKACMWEETKLKSTVINPSWNLVKANLRSSALDTWISASIPIVTLRRVKDMVHTLYNKYRSKSKWWKLETCYLSCDTTKCIFCWVQVDSALGQFGNHNIYKILTNQKIG